MLIPYENLQFYKSPKSNLNKLFYKPELTVLNNSTKIIEIKNLRNINKSNQLITILEILTKKN